MRRSTGPVVALAVAVLLPALTSCSGAPSAAAGPSSTAAVSAVPVATIAADEVQALPGYDVAPAAEPALPAAVVTAAGSGLDGAATEDLRKDGAPAGTLRLLRFAQSVTEDELAARMPAIVGAAGGGAAAPLDVRGDSALRAGSTVGLRIGWDVYLLTSASGPEGAATLADAFVSAVD